MKTSAIAYVAALLLFSSPTSSAMGYLHDCWGGGGGLAGRATVSPAQTDSMKLVDICLRNAKGPELRLRLPAAYLSSLVSDETGRIAFAHFSFWLPDYRPNSMVVELKPPFSSEQRAKYFRAHERDVVRVSLSAVIDIRDEKWWEYTREQYADSKIRLKPDKHGLEGFEDRDCESLRALATDKRDPATRKCASGSFGYTYFGRSNWTKKPIRIQCSTSLPSCQLHTTFQDREVVLSISKMAISDWRRYEDAANDFLRKYLMTIQ